jgi:hypothetical protein
VVPTGLRTTDFPPPLPPLSTEEARRSNVMAADAVEATNDSTETLSTAFLKIEFFVFMILEVKRFELWLEF